MTDESVERTVAGGFSRWRDGITVDSNVVPRPTRSKRAWAPVLELFVGIAIIGAVSVGILKRSDDRGISFEGAGTTGTVLRNLARGEVDVAITRTSDDGLQLDLEVSSRSQLLENFAARERAFELSGRSEPCRPDRSVVLGVRDGSRPLTFPAESSKVVYPVESDRPAVFQFWRLDLNDPKLVASGVGVRVATAETATAYLLVNGEQVDQAEVHEGWAVLGFSHVLERAADSPALRCTVEIRSLSATEAMSFDFGADSGACVGNGSR